MTRQQKLKKIFAATMLSGAVAVAAGLAGYLVCERIYEKKVNQLLEQNDYQAFNESSKLSVIDSYKSQLDDGELSSDEYILSVESVKDIGKDEFLRTSQAVAKEDNEVYENLTQKRDNVAVTAAMLAMVGEVGMAVGVGGMLKTGHNKERSL
jgi:hypothetical protein